MGVSCDPGCANWAKSFGDCICSPTDLASFVLGLASVVFMGVCCLPQIITNFMNGSSEGLSLGMILIWSVGDVCNLTGVFLTKALPTQVYMAVLFAVLDLLLNFQHCWYCYWIMPRRKKRQLAQQTSTATTGSVVAGTQDSEPQGSANKLQLTEKTSGQQPGKPDTDLSDDHAQTGSSSTAPSHQLSDISLAEAHSPVAQRPAKDQLISRGHQQRGAVSADIVHRKHGSGSSETHADVESYDLAAKIPAAHHLRALSAGLMMVGCGVMTTSVPTMITAGLTGTLPGASDYKSTSGIWGQDHSPGRVLLSDSGANAASGKRVNIGQGLGWVMTVTYLAARVPQIYKNHRRGTTEGLSLFMFALLVMGSVTYVLSIFIRSVEAQFVVPKLPWLIEALGAILLDGTILLQIFYYRSKNRSKPPPALPASDLPLGSIAP